MKHDNDTKNSTGTITADQVSITTVQVSLQIMKLGRNKFTLAVFNQLPSKELFARDADDSFRLAGEPWGYVRYKCARGFLTALFVEDGELFKCRVALDPADAIENAGGPEWRGYESVQLQYAEQAADAISSRMSDAGMSLDRCQPMGTAHQIRQVTRELKKGGFASWYRNEEAAGKFADELEALLPFFERGEAEQVEGDRALRASYNEATTRVMSAGQIFIGI